MKVKFDKIVVKPFENVTHIMISFQNGQHSGTVLKLIDEQLCQHYKYVFENLNDKIF